MNSAEVTAAFRAAVARERKDALATGVPIFYRDSATGLNVMEQPGGGKFEIRWVPGAPRDRNCEVWRELDRSAAWRRSDSADPQISGERRKLQH